MREHVSRDALSLRGRAVLADLPRLLQPASRPLYPGRALSPPALP